MALSGILWTSTAGLQAVQQQLQWRTDNISNAQNPSYARRDAVTTSTGANSVEVDVARANDSGLQDQFLTSNSQSSFTTAQLGYFQRVGDVLGTSQSTPFLQQSIDNFTGAWKSFETDTSSTTSEANVIATGQALGQTISSAAANLDKVENEVRDDVGNNITSLNAKLVQLEKINKQLSSEPLATSLNPSLFDTRDSLVRDISASVGVVRITHSDNSVALYTNGGVALIDHGANQFQWNNPAGTEPWISLVNTTGVLAPSPSLNVEFTGGKIGAGLSALSANTTALASADPKVGTIAKARAQLDNLAVQLAGQEPNTFGGAYYNSSPDRTTDLMGGIVNNSTVTASNVAPLQSGNPLYWGGDFSTNVGDLVVAASANGSGVNPIVTPTEPENGAAVVLPPQNNNVTPQPAGAIWIQPGNWDGTPLTSFFTIDNGTPGPPPTMPSLSPSGSFAINANLVNGTSTVKRQSATAVVAELTNTSRSMIAGGINSTNLSYSGLGSTIANYHSAGQAAVADDNTRYTQATQTFDTRLNSVVGVNMDTEMAQLTVLQNAYAANARVISAVQQMFDTLMAIGK